MIRRQYHGRHTDQGYLVWDVRKLLQQAQNLPIIEVPLSEISELDDPYWYQTPDVSPTCRHIADHFKQVSEADLAYPILLCADGGLMDGMHRVVKAYLQNLPSIKAQRLKVTPPPDYIDVDLRDLPYDD